MSLQEILLLALLFFAAAVLYTSVGHAGASAYLAAMALFGISPAVMKPTALVLNILVATFATIRYHRAGQVAWRALWPFLIGSVPLAYLGGSIQLAGHVYRPIVGGVLLLAAARLMWKPAEPAAESGVAAGAEQGAGALALWLSARAGLGAAIGLLSGLTGTGGGIFLTPLLLLTGWATARVAVGVSAAFILANSVAGLAGNWASVRALPPALPFWLVAVLAGALVGTELGTRRLSPEMLRRLLAVVLVIAALKLFLTR